MASNFAFVPQGATTTITATAGTATVTISGGPGITTGTYPPNGARIACIGTVAVFVQFGVGTATSGPTVALATGMPILANTIETFQFKGQNAMAFTSVGTATMYITPGEGL